MTLSTPSHNYFYSLLNRSPNDLVFKTLLQDYKDTCIVKAFSDCIYHSYKPLGVSLSFVGKESDNEHPLILDAIDIYNGATKEGFQPYTHSIPLPCGLSGTMQAHEIVSVLGEPDRKGGGGQTRMPCWIEYKFENNRGGLMIQLHGLDWDDRNMGWTSIVLYR